MSELRCYVFIDSLQPQFASFLATVAGGFLPTQHQAALFVEIAPGMDINKVTDVALKATNVTPGMMIIERLYGMLEIHSQSQADVRQAGRAILESLDLKEEERIKPKLLTSQVIRNISDYHSQLINRTRHGNMILPGHSLYVMECAPAGYAAPARPERASAPDRAVRRVLPREAAVALQRKDPGGGPPVPPCSGRPALLRRGPSRRVPLEPLSATGTVVPPRPPRRQGPLRSPPPRKKTRGGGSPPCAGSGRVGGRLAGGSGRVGFWPGFSGLVFWGCLVARSRFSFAPFPSAVDRWISRRANSSSAAPRPI